jgi:hypothetical protein
VRVHFTPIRMIEHKNIRVDITCMRVELTRMRVELTCMRVDLTSMRVVRKVMCLQLRLMFLLQ